MLLEVPTYPQTKFRSANIRHRPVRNHEGWAMFSKDIKCLATILCEQYPVVIRREGLIYEFAVDRRVIYHQDSEFLTALFCRRRDV